MIAETLFSPVLYSFLILDRLPPLTPEWCFFNTSTSFRKIAGDNKKFQSLQRVHTIIVYCKGN